MATTNYLNLSLLDVGQKEKEVSINNNMLALDTKVLRFLGDAPTNPSVTGIPKGSSYYNTTTSTYRILTAAGAWIDTRGTADQLLPAQTGNSGKYLTTNGTTVSWATVAGGGGSGTVTSIALSAGTTGLTTSGGPITTSGTITLAGTLAVTNGGTGATTAAAALNALTPSQTGNAGKALITNGSSISWQTVSGSGTVTSVALSGGTTGLTTSGGPITASGTITLAGTLAIAAGGTGATTAAAAITALLPSQTGNGGKVLITDGTSAYWQTVGGGGTVTSVALSGGTTGLTVSGSPITSSGTITLGGTLSIAAGGTGAVTAATALNALTPSQTGNSGKALVTNGSAISWTRIGAQREVNINFAGSFFLTNISNLETIVINRMDPFAGNVTFTMTFEDTTAKTFFIILKDNGTVSPSANQFTFTESGAGPLSSFTATLPGTSSAALLKTVHRTMTNLIIAS